MSICVRNGSVDILSININTPFNSNFLLNIMAKPQDFPLFTLHRSTLQSEFVAGSLLKKILGNDIINSTVNFTIMSFHNECLTSAINHMQNAYISNTYPEQQSMIKCNIEKMKKSTKIVWSDPFLLGIVFKSLGRNNNNVIKMIKKHAHFGPRFLYIPISLRGFWKVGHANFLLIDRVTRTIYYFEPHISNKYTTQIIGGLSNLCKKIMGSVIYEFKSIRELPIALRSIQQNDPLCRTWVLLFCCLYVLNIDNVDQSIVRASKYSYSLMDIFLRYIGQFENEIREWRESPLCLNVQELAMQVRDIKEFKNNFKRTTDQYAGRTHLCRIIDQYFECFDLYNKLDFSEVLIDNRILYFKILLIKWDKLLYILYNKRPYYVLYKIYSDIKHIVKFNSEAFTKVEIQQLITVHNIVQQYM